MDRVSLIRETMTPEEIGVWLELLIAVGESKAWAFGRDAIMYTDHIFTQRQNEEIYIFKKALPSYGQQRASASERIKLRVAARRAKKHERKIF